MARIPVLHLNEAKQLVQESGVGIEREQGSLSAAEERALGAAVLERYGTELVFVTHYHASARPFYAREVAGGETETFDLLFRGMEITTGGLRIHQPEMLKAKMLRLGMNLEPFRHYLSAFEYGLPPHGGSGTGLERLTMLLCGCKNVRQTVLFPRDRGRVEP
jgi:nondiscriminating aspartyl-tRNA synthetase